MVHRRLLLLLLLPCCGALASADGFGGPRAAGPVSGSYDGTWVTPSFSNTQDNGEISLTATASGSGFRGTLIFGAGSNRGKQTFSVNGTVNGSSVKITGSGVSLTGTITSSPGRQSISGKYTRSGESGEFGMDGKPATCSVTLTPGKVVYGLPSTNNAVSEAVTVTAKPSPSNTPVKWDGDLGKDPVIKKNVLTTHYDSPGDKTLTATVCDDPTTKQTVTITVVRVTFRSASGVKLPSPYRMGVSTSGHDRSQKLQAQVEPSSRTNDVTLDVAGSGGSRMHLSNIQNGNGSIAFTVDGVGKTGSTSKGDAVVEAKIAGTVSGQQGFTVSIPARVAGQTPGGPEAVNLATNETTSPAFPKIPDNALVLVTFYGWPVTVRVTDQFGDPVGDEELLYGGSDITEAFKIRSGLGQPQPINKQLSQNSDYVDPVGVQIYQGYSTTQNVPPPTVGLLSPEALNHVNNPTPVFPLPTVQRTVASTAVFQVAVDGFPLMPLISRTISLQPPSRLTLKTTP